MQKVAEHAATAHNPTKITDEVAAKVKGCIRDDE